ncbi:MAG: NAD(P)/FAD-dependent oxidoreductase [Nitrososphaeria archaeon]
MHKECKYLIIGSGIAGYYCLKELLTIDPDSKIIMVSSEGNPPYDRPPLSKDYLIGKAKRDAVFFHEQEYKRPNVELMLGREISSIDPELKMAFFGHEGIWNNDTNKWNWESPSSVICDKIHFDKALIATGLRPRKLAVDGEDLAGIYYLRTIDDADAIKRDVAQSKNPVIVGAGFIGIEVASGLLKMGLKPIIIERNEYIWATLVDKTVSGIIQKQLESRGMKFILNDGVKYFSGSKRVERVVTSSGREIVADFVLIAAGSVPNIEVASNSGMKFERGIPVDQYLRTEYMDIYAAGDIANIYNPSSGEREHIEHWNKAEYTGRLAARNMYGMNKPYNFLSTIWSDIMDLHIESAGNTSHYDTYIIRGNPDSSSFVAVYIKDNTVSGYLAINRNNAELKALNELILSRINVSGKGNCIMDESCNLNNLINTK